MRKIDRGNSAFKFNEWWKISFGREFIPYVDDTLTEKSGANIAAIWFLEQLVPVASSVCYSRKFKEIFYIYDNKAKNKFITPHKIS